MKTKTMPENYEHTSPAGAEVRVLMSNEHGGIAHCSLKAGKISRAVRHKTVSEFWHILSGKGAIWRRNTVEANITVLEAGITIDIPLGTDFQYRSEADTDLVFICVTMPPWSGADEANYIEESGWAPTV
jgi:mannose-6-phosphate isomerase-like protein (cupin superfamily)